MRLLAILKKISFFIILTMLTQVGGLIYLFYQPLSHRIKKRWIGSKQVIARIGVFLLLYLSFTFFIVPPIAKQFGRVTMPYFATNKVPVKPLTIFTCLLNRHYVKPVLEAQIIQSARRLKRLYPERRIVYLDANFPFWNGFPLLPHLSHDDGKKIDLAFLYKHRITRKIVNGSPSFLGYGVYEAPQKRELNQPSICARKGYWQYGFLERITPQGQKEAVIIDEEATKQFLSLLAQNKSIKKIFIEPHLKMRWGLENNNKIRYHGCHAVRHDDHIHVQL